MILYILLYYITSPVIYSIYILLKKIKIPSKTNQNN